MTKRLPRPPKASRQGRKAVESDEVLHSTFFPAPRQRPSNAAVPEVTLNFRRVGPAKLFRPPPARSPTFTYPEEFPMDDGPFHSPTTSVEGRIDGHYIIKPIRIPTIGILLPENDDRGMN